MNRRLDDLRGMVESIVAHVDAVKKMALGGPLQFGDKDNLLILSSLAGNLYDVVESVEKKFEQQEAQLGDLQRDVNRMNARTVQMAKDLARQDELEQKLDDLSTIILRSLKQLPVKGADEDERIPEFTSRDVSRP